MTRVIAGVFARVNAWPVFKNTGSAVIIGYGIYCLVGWLLLCLPIARATENGTPLDWLFVAVSAVSTTGLTPLSTGGDFTWLGQFVILSLIQLGGTGYMVIGSLLVLATTGTLSQPREGIVRASLSLPDGVSVKQMVWLVCLYTFAVETAGAALLASRFQALGVEDAVWSGVFHSISAFCTAGFGLYDNSLENFRSDWVINLTVMALSYSGAIGFLVVNDVWETIRKRRVTVTLTSRIILVSTAAISFFALVGLLIEERWWAELSTGEAILMAWFQAMTASTTVGFNTVPIGELSAASAFILFLCMLVGASPCGTGGGIKTTSFTACWGSMVAVIRGNRTPTFWGKEIPEIRRRLAMATVFFYMVVLSAGVYLVGIFEKGDFFNLIFECASALGTVGLSRGVTGSLSDYGLAVIIGLMFLGRVGPLALAVTLFRAKAEAEKKTENEDIVT